MIRNSDRILEELTSIIETERKGFGREERKEQEDFVLLPFERQNKERGEGKKEILG